MTERISRRQALKQIAGTSVEILGLGAGFFGVYGINEDETRRAKIEKDFPIDALCDPNAEKAKKEMLREVEKKELTSFIITIWASLLIAAGFGLSKFQPLKPHRKNEP